MSRLKKSHTSGSGTMHPGGAVAMAVATSSSSSLAESEKIGRKNGGFAGDEAREPACCIHYRRSTRGHASILLTSGVSMDGVWVDVDDEGDQTAALARQWAATQMQR